MALLTPAQAATRLNRTERTIRRWIEKEHKLEATKAIHGHHKYLIDEQEVERLKSELEQEQPVATSEQEQEQDTSSLLDRIDQLEQMLRDYQDQTEQKIAALESLVSKSLPALSAAATDTRTRTPRATASTASTEPPADIPAGSILHGEFSEQHGISSSTYKGQLENKEFPVWAITIPKSNRKNEFERWITPAEQRASIRFWLYDKRVQKSRENYHPCDVPACPCHEYQDTSEQQQLELEQDSSEP